MHWPNVAEVAGGLGGQGIADVGRATELDLEHRGRRQLERLLRRFEVSVKPDLLEGGDVDGTSRRRAHDHRRSRWLIAAEGLVELEDGFEGDLVAVTGSLRRAGHRPVGVGLGSGRSGILAEVLVATHERTAVDGAETIPGGRRSSVILVVLEVGNYARARIHLLKIEAGGKDRGDGDQPEPQHRPQISAAPGPCLRHYQTPLQKTPPGEIAAQLRGPAR